MRNPSVECGRPGGGGGGRGREDWARGKIGQEVQYEVHHVRDCDFTTVTNLLVRHPSVECGRPWGVRGVKYTI